MLSPIRNESSSLSKIFSPKSNISSTFKLTNMKINKEKILEKSNNGIFLLRKDLLVHNLIQKSIKGNQNRDRDRNRVPIIVTDRERTNCYSAGERHEDIRRDIISRNVKVDPTSGFTKMLLIENILKYNQRDTKIKGGRNIDDNTLKKVKNYTKIKFPKLTLKSQSLAIFDMKKTGTFNSFSNTNLERFKRKDIKYKKIENLLSDDISVKNNNLLLNKTDFKNEIRIEKSPNKINKKSKKKKQVEMLDNNYLYTRNKTSNKIGFTSPPNRYAFTAGPISPSAFSSYKTKESCTQTQYATLSHNKFNSFILQTNSSLNKNQNLSNIKVDSLRSPRKFSSGRGKNKNSYSNTVFRDTMLLTQNTPHKISHNLTIKNNFLGNNNFNYNNLNTNNDASSISVAGSNKDWTNIITTESAKRQIY